MRHGIRIVDAIDLRGFQHHIGIDFRGPQSRRRICGKIRIPRTASKNHDAAFFQMADGTPTDIQLSYRFHLKRRLHARNDAQFLQGWLQRETVDNRGQHSHVIAGRPFDAPLASGQAAENVPSANDDDDLDAKLAHFADLTGHVVNALRANTDARFASQRLATELEQDATIFWRSRLGHNLARL